MTNEINKKLDMIEKQMRGIPVHEVMLQVGFQIAATDAGEKAYFKRFGDVGILITTDASALPETWDEKVNLAFMEFWTNGEMQFIHEYEGRQHFAITDTMLKQTMFTMSFYDENKILEWLKHHAPDLNKIQPQPVKP